VIERDLISSEGMLLLAHDHVLDAALIEQIRAHEKSEGRRITLFIQV